MISEKRLSYADKRVSTVTSKNKTITIQDFFFCHLSRSIFGQLRYLNYRTFFILVINQLNAQNLFYNKFIPCLYIYLNNNQLDALNFIMSLFHASTCFENHVAIVRRPNLYYTVSDIITPIGVMIPETV